MHAIATQPGLVVVDASLKLLAFNSEALQILTFPEHPDKVARLDEWISIQIRTRLLDGQPLTAANVAAELRSSRRTYICRSFPVSASNGSPQRKPSLAILMERRTNGTLKLAQICGQYGLTARELETVELLLQGLTSKEIAERMKISPNTVKAFIRLVMVKMSVSTRSGIIGKIVSQKG